MILLRSFLLAFFLNGVHNQATAKDPLIRHTLDSHGSSIELVHHLPKNETENAHALLLIPGWPAINDDVLGIGESLSAAGVHVLILHPRGHGDSEGIATFNNTIDDVAIAWEWMSAENGGGMYGIDANKMVLAGYSWGGGIAMAFAAQNKNIKRIASLAGSDHGVFISRFDNNPEYAAIFRQGLLSTQKPHGPVRFDLEDSLNELREKHSQHDLVTLCPLLADRDLLLIVAWDDQEVEIEHQVLPFYRSMNALNADAIKIVAFQDNHGFKESRDALSGVLYQWLIDDSSETQ